MVHHHHQPIIISTAGTQALGTYGSHIRRTGHNPPSGSSADWLVLTPANAAGTDSLTCFPNYGGARDNKILITHPKTDQRCLGSTIARRVHLPCHRATKCVKLVIYSFLYIPLTLYPRKGSRGISDIPPRHPHFTKIN
jgi:hypothetical protein